MNGPVTYQYKIEYSFRTNLGKQISNKVDVTQEVYNDLSGVTIVYLPGKPQISAMETMVEMVRHAMKK